MEVYLVTNGDRYDFMVYGVFSTREKAQKYVDENTPALDLEIEEWDVQ